MVFIPANLAVSFNGSAFTIIGTILYIHNTAFAEGSWVDNNAFVFHPSWAASPDFWEIYYFFDNRTVSYTQFANAGIPSATQVLNVIGPSRNSTDLWSGNLQSNSTVICFKEGSKILTDKGYKPIQDLRKGDLVKTLKHDYKAIDMIGKSEIYHSAVQERIHNQLYKCSKSKYPEIFEPLIITGHHSILVNDFISDEQRDKISKELGRIYVTDDKYRLPVSLDERASVYETPGNYTIYHLALENDNYYMNYGIYANGLLVETCSKRYLKELSNMSLIE